MLNTTMSSSKANNLLIFGALAAAAAVGLMLYQMQNSDTEREEPRSVHDGQTAGAENGSESRLQTVGREIPPAKASEEDQDVKQQKHAESILARSDSLTELAANTDGTIAEQNRQIATGKEQFVRTQQMAAMTPKKEQNEAVDEKDERYMQGKTKVAEAMVSGAYEPEEEAATSDPTVAEENKEIAVQQKQILLRSQGGPSPEAQSDENHDSSQSSLHKNQNRRRNKNKKKVTAVASGVENNGSTSPTEVAAILKAKTKGTRSSKKKNVKGSSAAAAAVKELNNFQASTKKKKSKTKNRQ